MPSLRKRVTSYIRQLSFHNESREKRQNINENSFITKYLQGQIKLKDGPPVISGKVLTDLPNYDLATYHTGSESIVGCYTGPNGGLTTVKRSEKHLSIADPDIDFIDTQQEESASYEIKTKGEIKKLPSPIDNTTMVIKVAGQEYFVTNRKKQVKSQSAGSLSDLNSTNFIQSNGQTLDLECSKFSNSNDEITSKEDVSKNMKSNDCDSKENLTGKNVSNETSNSKKRNVRKSDESRHIHGTTVKYNAEGIRRRSGSNRSNSSTKICQSKQSTNKTVGDGTANANNSTPIKLNAYKTCEEKQISGLLKSKSEGNPFQHRKHGKIIKISQRPISAATVDGAEHGGTHIDDVLLPEEWQKYSEHIYGLSDSLYDKNQISNIKNGDPVADCFGIIARKDSAILAVADGVNWGEKACIAAKSAIHGCLHYLNMTIFNDTKPFEKLIKGDVKEFKSETSLRETHISNTQEVFVCLLRAFNCAHDLILENNGMLTTLTVAVILPLKRNAVQRQNEDKEYVCCVCNVGDTLAYVYSHKYGIRELTKGSHDIQSNRDMRDALGALGPVDGTNPELSNLTISVTKMQKGDIVLVASDGLTDNFDPNVCKFTVNSSITDSLKAKREPSTFKSARQLQRPLKSPSVIPIKKEEPVKKPPIKPPRRNFVKGSKTSIGGISSQDTVDHSRRVSNDVGGNSDVKIANTVETVDNLEMSSPANDNNNENNRNGPNSQDLLNSNDLKDSNSQREVKTSDEDDSGLLSNPLVAQFLRENSIGEGSSLEKCKRSVSSDPKPIKTYSSQLSRPSSVTLQQQSSNNKTLTQKTLAEPRSGQKYNFLRSKTSLDLRVKTIQRNEDGIPYVTPIQRYELTLLLIEDILKHGISGRESECVTAKKLCENLMRFTFSITAAKRRTLEDNDMYYDNQNGLLIEISAQEKKIRRKRGLEKVQNLPGKLDHVTVVAFNVGNYSIRQS
ncbi:hypothetical protein AMK59_7283 [Oryctes borbonicus]|uniref:PPM-type phosphatase domain-containing protein n=1 Tax=Oryctes borbonicus TaxID=1629725 RepID=A0A0T6B0Z5_9SCAR|nr:hypothetical protein AMK59_7283 [Oryctes borbonicus]